MYSNSSNFIITRCFDFKKGLFYTQVLYKDIYGNNYMLYDEFFCNGYKLKEYRKITNNIISNRVYKTFEDCFNDFSKPFVFKKI